jgi:hypothetical protein
MPGWYVARHGGVGDVRGVEAQAGDLRYTLLFAAQE